MTARKPWHNMPDRCPGCGFASVQGHRSIDNDGEQTGCPDSGELGMKLKAEREADRRKQEAFTRLDTNDTADESTLIRRAILATGRTKPRFTPDDLPADIRQRTNPNRRGRIFSALLDEGVITEVDRVKSLNPRAHGKKVGVYQIRGAA